MADQAQAAAHWDDAYAQGADTRSWLEQHPDMSLRMLDSAGVSTGDALIDAGGGASPSPGRCWIAASATSRSWTSPRPGCSTPATASARELTRFTG
jgi:hypothetical protein